MMPLVPPATDADAEVGVLPFTGLVALMLVMSKDITHPVVFDWQNMVSFVCPLSATLKKIKSVPFKSCPLVISILGLKNSVTGEQGTLAVVSVGPGAGVPITPEAIGICHSVLSPL